MHGLVPQASPPQPQFSNSTTSARTPSVARSAAYFLQLHLEYGVEPTHSCWICALPGSQGPRECTDPASGASRQPALAAELPQTRQRFLGHFRRFVPYTRVLAQHAHSRSPRLCDARPVSGAGCALCLCVCASPISTGDDCSIYLFIPWVVRFLSFFYTAHVRRNAIRMKTY